MEAVIYVTEVKDYPNRWVPAGEFTAIGENLKANWEALARTLTEQLDELSEAQGDALADALREKSVRVELRFTPGTRIGQSGPNNALEQLNRVVTDVFESEQAFAGLTTPITEEELLSATERAATQTRESRQ